MQKMFHMDRLVAAMFLLFCTLLTDGVQGNINTFKGPPNRMTLRWDVNEMIIQSVWEGFNNKVSHDCFDLVLQLRTRNTEQWQISKTSDGCKYINDVSIECNFINQELDKEKCFEMQAKFQTKEICFYSTYESQWSNITFMKNGSLYDVCPEDATDKHQTTHQTTHQTKEMQRFVIILFSTVLSAVFLLIIFIGCLMKRMKKCVFPIVPDPKNAFYDLYDNHNGYLQEWMKAPRNNAQLEEIESVLGEQDGDRVSTILKDNAGVTLDSQCLTEEPVDPAITTSVALVENVSDGCFGNMNFTMSDSTYIML